MGAALPAVAPPPSPVPQDWTDRVMDQWMRYKPNPKGGGDFPDQQKAGMASHDLLEGANPREVINPDRESLISKVPGA